MPRRLDESPGLVMTGFVKGIYLAPEGSARMERAEVAMALEGCGLKADRYCAGTGHWSRFGRVCEVTFIAAEDLYHIEQETGLRVKHGEHRRNIVTSEVNLKALRRGERFRVGETVFEHRGPRSVCRYIERLTEAGMTRALKGRGGTCAMVVEGGPIRVEDEIESAELVLDRVDGHADESVIPQEVLDIVVSRRFSSGLAGFTRQRPRSVGSSYPSDQPNTAHGCERAERGHCRSLGSGRWCPSPSPRRPSLPRADSPFRTLHKRTARWLSRRRRPP